MVTVRDSSTGLGSEADRVFTPFSYNKDTWHGDGLVYQPVTRRNPMVVDYRPPQALLTVQCFRSPCQQTGVLRDRAFRSFVVDDDPSVRSSLKFLFRIPVGLQVETFDSADSFLRKELRDVSSCLVLDIRLPGLSGLDFQRELATRNIRIPIVFLTGHGDIPMSVRAMKAGAVEFLTKPFRIQVFSMLFASHLIGTTPGANKKRKWRVFGGASTPGLFASRK